MKNTTTVKLAMDATEPAQRVRLIVLTDELSDRIGPRLLPHQRIKLLKFRSHRFTPEIQVRPRASLEALNSGNVVTKRELLESRECHRAISFQ